MSNATHTITEPQRERSRNAKAQARHRAKRKAYIESLEQTVTALQLKLGVPNEDLSVLPPPSAKIRDLEVENAKLKKENEELRQMLGQPHSRPNPRDALEYRSNGHQNFSGQQDQQRKLPAPTEDSYSHPASHDPLPRPSLHIPTSNSHYSSLSSSHTNSSTPSSYSLNALRVPDTPSASNTSEPASPSYSPATNQYPQVLPYSSSTGGSYPPIKMEEYENQYQPGPNRFSHHGEMTYSQSMHSFSPPQWHHGYASER